MQQPYRIRDAGLVALAHRDEHRALAWYAGPAAELAFCERHLEGAVDAHDLAGRAHLRAEHGVDAGETRERENRLFHADMAGLLLLQLEIGKLLAGHDPRGDLRHRRADDLGDERHGARRPRIDLEYIDLVVLDGVLHVHQADHVEAEREFAGLPFEL